jgi:hypothetical protein
MRRIVTTAAVVLTALATATTAFAGTVAETFVEGGSGNQFSGDGNSTYLTWAANSGANPDHYDSMFRPLVGGTPVVMNDLFTQGFAGDINGDTTEAVYQQVAGSSSDIYLYDLDLETRTAAPAAVNTALWEWSPSVSDGFILFGRNKFNRPGSLWKIMLYDRNADTSMVLDSARNDCQCIFPGQVSDQYATWTHCSQKTCQAWFYDIAGDTTKKVPNPNDKVQYFPAVSGSTGDLYFVQSAFACGAHLKIMRWDPAGGPASVVSTQPPGYDVYLGPNVFDDTGGHQDVYVDRQRCGGKYYADIYVINDADTAFTREVAGGPAGSASFTLPVVPGATPRG